MKTLVKFCVVFCLVICIPSAIVRATEKVSKIIANINGEIITSTDIDDYCNFLAYKDPQIKLTPEFRKEILHKLIEDKLVVFEGKKEEMPVPPAWVEGRVQEYIKSYPSPEAFEDSLVTRGLNMTLLRERLKDQYLRQKMVDKHVRSKIIVSPNEVTDFYQNNSAEFTFPEKYVLWTATSGDEQVLKSLSLEVEREGIGNVDRDKYGLSSAEVPREKLKDSIKEFIAGISVGQSRVGRIDNKCYFIHLEKIIPASRAPLEEVKDDIYQRIMRAKFEALFNEWVLSLKEKAVIKIYE